MVTIAQDSKSRVSLFSKARSEILALLYPDPSKEYYLREIVYLTGLGIGPVQRELTKLVKLGLVKRRDSGHQVYFSTRMGPIFEELRSIIIKTVGGAGEVKNALWPLRRKIDLAFIYGSYARGDVGSLSDIDVMVVGDVSLENVVGAILPAMEKLRRKINPTVLTKAEFDDKLQEGHYFVTNVWQGKKLMLVGGDHDTSGNGKGNGSERA